MTSLHPALSHARAFVFDLGGTLYVDDTPVPGAAGTVQALHEAGCPIRFLTNTTSRSRPAIVEKLHRLGFPAEEHHVYSPPAVAGAFLRERQATAHLLVLEATLADFEGVTRDHEAPDYVVVGDLGGGWTFERLNEAFQMIQQRGAELIGLGRTRYWQSAGSLQLDAGPFITALEYATGREALILGKPAPAFFRAAIEDLDVPAEQVVLVGDDAETDVQAAMQAGFTGALVRTGAYRDGDEERAPAPDTVLDSAADVLA